MDNTDASTAVATRHRSGIKFHALLPVIVVFIISTYSTVGLRLLTRKKYAKLWWDDWLMVVSLLLFTVYCSSSIAMLVVSEGASGITQIPLHSTATAIKLLLVAECFYILAMIVLKLSLGFFFLRILASQWQRWLIIAAVSTSTMFGVAYFFFAIFQCGFVSSVQVLITRMVNAQCAAKPTAMAMNYVYALLGTISDWTCGLVPVFILRNSNMPKKARMLVCALLVFASIGSIASIVRMFYLDAIVNPSDDYFKRTCKLAIWSTIEPGVGITVASVACLRRLFQRIFTQSKMFGSRDRQNSTAPSRIECTTTITQDYRLESGMAVRHASQATTLQGASESRRKSSAVKSMAEEMRAYGLCDYENVTTVTERDLEEYVADPPAVDRWTSMHPNAQTVASSLHG